MVGENATRRKLDEGLTAFGCFLRHPSPGVAEVLALQGLDFVVFDGEHGPLSPAACEDLSRAVELHGVTPLVRIESNSGASILRYLDAGAMGCHIPDVDSPAAAIEAVRAVKFRPMGDRGLSASRASGYGAGADYGAYTEFANRETQVVAHIESRAGVQAVEEIAEVEGVDVLLFGALDLSHDLEIPGRVEDAEVLRCAERVAAAAARADKHFGAAVSDAENVRFWRERGARYLVCTVEGLLRPGTAALLAASAA